MQPGQPTSQGWQPAECRLFSICPLTTLWPSLLPQLSSHRLVGTPPADNVAAGSVSGVQLDHRGDPDGPAWSACALPDIAATIAVATRPCRNPGIVVTHQTTGRMP